MVPVPIPMSTRTWGSAASATWRKAQWLWGTSMNFCSFRSAAKPSPVRPRATFTILVASARVMLLSGRKVPSP